MTQDETVALYPSPRRKGLALPGQISKKKLKTLVSWLLKGRNRGFILSATLERVPLPGNSHNERFIVPNFV